MSRFDDLVNRFSTTRIGRFVGSKLAARVDPLVFQATGGRFTGTGRATLPMLALTTTGRRTGQRRTVQLAYVDDGDDWLVVTSNFGQDHHPAWRHNLLADPNAWVLTDGGEEHAVRASRLSADEKAAHWSRIESIVPQMKVYPGLTSREIEVYRLTRR